VVFPDSVDSPRTSVGGLGGGGPGRTLASLEDDVPMMRSASREGRNERVVHPGGAGGPWLERQHGASASRWWSVAQETGERT
jgi:hypothetical protein